MYGKMRFRSKYEKSGGTQLECLQTEYDSMYDYITQGAIIRSRATWYEFGERNNKYFFESVKLPIKRKAPCGKSSTGKEN